MLKPNVPIIDWNNPLTKMLVLDIPFFEGGGNPLNIVSKLTATPSATVWTPERFGKSLLFASGSSSKLTTQFTAHSTLRSYEVFLKRTGGGGSNLGRIFDKRTASAQVELWFYNNPFEYDRVWAGGQGTWKWADPVGLNVWQHLVLTYDASATTNDPLFYVNAIPQALSSDSNPASGPITNNADPYVIGNRGNDNARGWDGPMAYFRIYNKILTPNEIKQLCADPFRIYKRLKSQGADAPAAGGFNPALTRRRLLV